MPNTWNTWCGTSASTNTNTNTTDTWYYWNNSTSTTSDTSATTDCSNTQTIWLTWTSDCTPNAYRPQKSVEELRIEEHTRLQREADVKVSYEKRIAARKRAMKLLLENLTKKQKEQFAKHQFFIIEGGKSKRKYRIRGNPENTSIPMANIDVLHHDNDNAVEHRICFHLSYEIPLGDQLLAQKLMLENDEDRAIEVSNRHAA